MTLPQMEAIATDLQARVKRLEQRKLPASYAPQNNYYVTNKNVTSSTALTSAFSTANPGAKLSAGNTAEKRKATQAEYEALQATIASVEFALAQDSVVRVSATIQANVIGGLSSPFEIALLLDGAEIKTRRTGALKANIQRAWAFSGGNAHITFNLGQSFGVGAGDGFVEAQATNEENHWEGSTFAGAAGIALIVPAGQHEVSLHVHARKETPPFPEEAVGWEFSVPVLALTW